MTGAARAALGRDLMPEWPRDMPRPAPARLPSTTREGAAAVYLPACINRIFGNSRRSPRGPTLPETLVEVSRRAGRPVWIPDDVAGSCCSTVWNSKGFRDAHQFTARTVVDKLWAWTDGGALPVVVDASSCTLGLVSDIVPYLDEAGRARHSKITFIDSVAWAANHLAPRLAVTHPVPSAVVHGTCSMRHLGTVDDLVSLVGRLAIDVVVPDTMTCCAFAGDRGFLHPELTRSATSREAQQVSPRRHDAYVSANRTCEIGMEAATGVPYESVLFLLEQATRPGGPR
jgi:D-lactate dehydrogenase